MYKLTAIFQNSAMLINMFSTLNLEASIFDCPIINVCYNGYQVGKPVDIRQDIAIDEIQVHNQRLLRYGALSLAYNEDELHQAINQYLEHPKLHKAQRKHLCENECGPNPGKAGGEIAEQIHSILTAQ